MSLLSLFGCCRASEGLLDQVDLRASRVVLEPEERRYSIAQHYCTEKNTVILKMASVIIHITATLVERFISQSASWREWARDQWRRHQGVSQSLDVRPRCQICSRGLDSDHISVLMLCAGAARWCSGYRCRLAAKQFRVWTRGRLGPFCVEFSLGAPASFLQSKNMQVRLIGTSKN